MSNPILPFDPKLLVKEERILWAAIKVFSQYPFSVATIKMIADEAELPLSAVIYHHKSKENLYLTVLERLVPNHKKSKNHYSCFLDSDEKTDRKAAQRMLEEYLCDTIDGFYNDEEKDWYSRIMFFESLYPSPMFETLYEKYFKPNSELLLGLIKAATGNEDENLAMMHAAGIMGHLTSFRIFREFIVRQTTLVGYSKEEKERIKTLVINSIKPIFEIESK